MLESTPSKKGQSKFLTPAKPADKTLTPDEFIKEFKPKKNCKECYERGYHIRIEGHRGAKTPVIRQGFRRINFCNCVLKQYWRSGKTYDLKEEKPKEEKTDVPMQP